MLTQSKLFVMRLIAKMIREGVNGESTLGKQYTFDPRSKVWN
jgi:hypothetical protein